MNVPFRDPVIWLPVTPRLRANLERTIETLIDLLDEIDGDADLEEAGDSEPWLGNCAGGSDDREKDHDFEPPST